MEQSFAELFVFEHLMRDLVPIDALPSLKRDARLILFVHKVLIIGREEEHHLLSQSHIGGRDSVLQEFGVIYSSF